MRSAALLTVLFASACTRPTEPPPSTSAADPVSVIRRVERGRALLARIDAPASGWGVVTAPLAIRPATDGSGATRIAVDESVWLEVRALDTFPVPIRDAANHVRVALAAAPGVDVVHVAEPLRFEELRVLRDAKASHTARYELRFGAGIVDARLVNGTLQLTDAAGRVRIASEALWATDASGASIAVTLRFQRTTAGGLVTIAIAEGAWAYPVVVDPGWTKVAGTSTAATPAAAFELTPGGKVLVVGLTEGSNDLYDPTLGYVVAAAKRVTFARSSGIVSRSGSGQIYVAAGSDSTAERYNPATDTWTAVAPLPTAVTFAGAWPLGTNKLLLAGGYEGAGPVTTARIFDEGTGSWTTTGALNVARGYPATVVLKDGRPMIIGGFDSASSAISVVEIFNPATSTWTFAASMKRPRTGFTAITLASGKVLAVGGLGTAAVVTTSELYDPTGNAWTDLPAGGPAPSTGSAGGIRGPMGLVQLASGRVLYSGPGIACAIASWLYDPAKPLLGWVQGPDSPSTMCEDVPTLLASGQALFPGSYDRAVLTWTEPVANGTTCASGFECLSGLCVDGVCCDTACTSACQACNVAGTLGTCSAVPAGNPVGTRMCAGSTGCVGTCDGTSSLCVQPAAGATCQPATCVGSTFTAVSTCNPQGACVAPATATGCAPYGCDPSGCKTSCASDGDCASGMACRGGACGVPTDAGASDTGASEDTSAPDAASEVAIADAPAPPISVKPTVSEVQRCGKDSECSTGHCVEGVCCDTACADRCHSCALLEAPGKCTLEPIGVDLRSECGAAFSCTGTCDGTGSCIGAGKGSMCARNRCVSASTGVGPAYCSGPGAKCSVDDLVPFDCAPYVCENAFGACRTTCVSSNDCANGFVCDPSVKTCVTPVAVEEDSGCAIHHRPSHATAALLALAALGLVRRRRHSPGSSGSGMAASSAGSPPSGTAP